MRRVGWVLIARVYMTLRGRNDPKKKNVGELLLNSTDRHIIIRYETSILLWQVVTNTINHMLKTFNHLKLVKTTEYQCWQTSFRENDTLEIGVGKFCDNSLSQYMPSAMKVFKKRHLNSTLEKHTRPLKSFATKN